MSDIYQQLWDADLLEDRNGCTVSGRTDDGNGWVTPDAEILVDVQVKASGKRNRDLAGKPLFARVPEEKLASNDVYKTFINLLDNYVASAREEEEETAEERREINAFLNEVAKTKVFERGLAYINEQLGENLTPQAFKAVLNRLWFELFTNYFGGNSTEYASGFEHVFVGEGKYDTHSGGELNLGEISGYHSWVKFYLDEKLERVNFLGYKYDLRGGIIPTTPNVVTLQMLWNLIDMQGRVVAQLFKKKGGFFVGPSPACELVSGAVAYYESVHGLVVQDKRRTLIHDGKYDLVIYRSTTPQGARGEFIRSFYPEFLGPAEGGGRVVRDPLIDEPKVTKVPKAGYHRGPVVISAALPNPAGDDQGKEWVELTNRSKEAVSIDGWELRDRASRALTLSGSIGAGEAVRIEVPASSGVGFALSNKGGFISLHDFEGMASGVNYDKADSDVVLKFAID
ncbi:MAG: lamin tail domain-containing protein [Polyangiaceae bacterium]|nr:lamin tail domain-containing protein [Polyangiaceae bacterium]